MITIRETPAGDARVRLLEGHLQDEYIVLYGEPDPNPEGGLSDCTFPNGAVLLATNGSDEPVAVAGWHWEGDNVAVLRRMFVDYAYRGQGLGRRVLAAVERSAHFANARTLVLETGTAQHAAIALYRGMGYEPVEPFGFYAGQSTSVFLGRSI